MKKFVVERHLPGAGKLSAADLKNIAEVSCAAVNAIGKPYHWVQSFVTDDKIYCVHIAESEEVIREHAALGKFPVTAVSEVRSLLDPVTGQY